MCAPGHLVYRHTTIGVRGFGVWAVWGVWAFFFKREIEISKKARLPGIVILLRAVFGPTASTAQTERVQKMENLDWPHWSLFGFDH